MRRACIAAPPIPSHHRSRCGGFPQINDASAGWRLLQSYDDTEKSVGNWGLVDLPGISLGEFGGAVLLSKF